MQIRTHHPLAATAAVPLPGALLAGAQPTPHSPLDAALPVHLDEMAFGLQERALYEPGPAVALTLPASTAPTSTTLAEGGGAAPSAGASGTVLSLADSPAKLKRVRQAEALVERFAGETSKLYPSCGFATRDELVGAIQASTPAARSALDLLLNEDLEIETATPTKVRDQIARQGFFNFRDAGASASMVMSRDLVEADYAGFDSSEFAQLHSDLKPKYGLVSPKPGSGFDEAIGVRNYGGDRFVFNLDRIRKRVTFTLGDSANRHLNNTGDAAHLATSWDQRFAPWSMRELAAPALAQGLEEHKMGLPMSTFEESLKAIRDEWPFGAANHLIQLTESADEGAPVTWTSLENGIEHPKGSLDGYKTAWDTSLDYIEAQIWGPIDLNDVKAFEFTDTPPSGAFLHELQARGIEIRDGRQHPPAVWVG
jgi:hypothetical protein